MSDVTKKTNPYSLFATDKDFETMGRWQDYGDFRIKLARSGGKNTMYTKVLTKFINSLKHKKNVSTEESQRVMAEVFARGVLKGWQVKNDKGQWEDGMHLEVHVEETGEYVIKVVEVTVENVIKMFLALPDFANELRAIADDANTFKKLEEDEITGN